MRKHAPSKTAKIVPKAPAPAKVASASLRDGDGQQGGVLGGVHGGVVGGTVGGTGHLHVGPLTTRLPVLVSKVLPEYPPMARLRGIEGQVLLEAVVTTDGRIEPDIAVLHSVPLLDKAAITAVRQWRFRPARDRHGQPLRASVRVPVQFVLR